MASLLRSSKFVRYIVGFTRNIAVNPVREFENNAFQSGQCVCSILTRSLASQVATQHAQNDQTLEKSLRRLDEDVRRSGRISRRDIEDILEEIRHSRSASSSQSLLVIRCCGSLVPEERPVIRTQLVQEIWKTLNKLNVPMDISHYNALLRVYLENEHPFSPVEFLAELEKTGIEPNRVTYQRLIARYCQQGEIEGATQILEFMREKQLPVNENVFNALILGHSQSDDMESAKGILTVMQQAGLEPSADTYTTLLCGYARQGNLEKIIDGFKTCEENKIYLLDKDYMDIIFSLAINNHTEHIPVLIGKMRKSLGYNQDAINLSLKLINHEREEVALEILKTMPRGVKEDGESYPVGGFFVKQLVKTNRPAEKILSICKYLQTEGLNPRALVIAADASIRECNEELVYPLLNEMKKENFPIRPHYFWPLIVSKGETRNNNDVMNVVKYMSSQYDIVVTGETIRDYVLPSLRLTNSERIVNTLRESGISTASAATNLVYYLLTKFNLKEAAEVASTYEAHYSPSLLRRPLALGYLKSKDINSYLRIVRYICVNLKRIENVQPGSNEGDQESVVKFDEQNVIGQMIWDIAVLDRNTRIQNVSDIVNGLVAEGLSINNKSAERLIDLLGEQITPEISTNLAKLTSGELIPVPLTKSEFHKPTVWTTSAFQVERLLKTAEAKGEDTKNLKRQLLSIYCKNKDLGKAEMLLSQLTTDNFEFNPGVYAQLIDLYTNHDSLEQALSYLQKLKEIEPNYSLDDIKVIKLASLLIKNHRFDDAVQLLKEQPNARKQERTFGYTTTCWRLLTSLADEGKAEDLKTLYDTLLAKDYIEPSNVILGPLVKVHLVNGDLPKAMDVFEQCCKEHRTTPWKNELTCKLIQTEDAINLQKLTDLSTNIHGEVNSLYDLVFAFVECGRVRQARKILETPGLRTRQQRVDVVCERYSQEGQTDSLEGLIEATKDLHHIDRSNIFTHLLNTYIKQDKSEQALGLWTRMQDEDTKPTDEFLITLGKYLKSKSLVVPFVIPQTIPSKKSVPPASVKDNVKKTVNAATPLSEDIINYRKALKTQDVDTAMQFRNKLNVDQLSIMDHSLLIESLVKSDRLNDAKNEVLNMVERNLHPIPRVFRFFLNKLALTGDIDTLRTIGANLSPEIKKLISFDNRFCHANIVAGKSEEYLADLEKTITNATKDEIEELGNSFPRGGVMGILETHSHLTTRFEIIAEKYAAHGIVAPMNVLWIKHFISNENEDAERIWTKYLINSPRLMFQRVVQYARDNNDEAVVWKLVRHLKTAKVSEGALGNAYSCLVDVLVAQDKHDEALNVLKTAVDDVCLENINRTALMRLKESLNKSGKQFPYQIPAKNIKSSTSSSSSSDDEKKKN